MGKKIIWLLCILLLISLVLLVACDPETTTVDTTKSDIQESGNEESVSEEVEEEPIEDNAELTTNYFKNEDFMLSIGDVNKDYTEEYMENKDGFRVVQIAVSYENLSDTEQMVEGFNAKADKRMLDEYFSMNDDLIILETVLSESILDGNVYYEVPADAKELTLVYEYDWLSDKKIEFKIDVGL